MQPCSPESGLQPREREGEVQAYVLSPLPAHGNPRSHLNTPAVTEHFLMLGCEVALIQGSRGPGGKQEKINMGCDPRNPLRLRLPTLSPHLERTTTMA